MGFMAPAAVLGDIIVRGACLMRRPDGSVGLFLGHRDGTHPNRLYRQDRPQVIYPIRAAIGAIGNFGFGLVADGPWSGVIFRVLTGIGLAGTFMPGLKALPISCRRENSGARRITRRSSRWGREVRSLLQA